MAEVYPNISKGSLDAVQVLKTVDPNDDIFDVSLFRDGEGSDIDTLRVSVGGVLALRVEFQQYLERTASRSVQQRQRRTFHEGVVQTRLGVTWGGVRSRSRQGVLNWVDRAGRTGRR